MAKSICIINGHPDGEPERFVAALCEAYAHGAVAGGHAVSRIDIAGLPIDFLSSEAEFAVAPGAEIVAAQEAILAADHLVLAYPLWLGTIPARLKAFLEQIGRAGFLLDTGGDSHKWPVRRMRGKSVRIIVTMGMPGFAYRLLFGAHSLKGLEAGIFRMSGFSPVRHTIFGGVGACGPDGRQAMLDRVERLGRQAR
ncbi:NAD(P)H-dependent oxidoreductase [Maricaulis maris]|jgi:putative NADPH-quinone reductase|uniref:NAD(P)H-dependent oxidoreductase n=1 Tax=Maricaulis maris TaxID=74318 RepID=UPI0026EAE8B8|nr:NAD(P)H-dependent oxidoreductase [Maricaulis maris]